MSLASEQRVTADCPAGTVPDFTRRLPSDDAIKSARIERLIASEAWTDAALALVERELPQWQVRRLVYDGGEWFCLLSRQRELPDWLDQPVEAHHADLARAILTALAEARRITAPPGAGNPAVLHDAEPYRETVYCDNLG